MDRTPARHVLLHALLLAAALAGPLATPGLRGQDPPPAKPAPKPPSPVWPKLGDADSERAKLDVRRLGSDDPAVAEEAERDLIALGPAVAPYLFQRLADRQPPAPDVLGQVLDRVVTAEFAPLVADKALSRAELVRCFVFRYLALLHDPQYRPLLERATADASDEVRFLASLGLCAVGDTAALAPVFAVCAEQWRDRAELVSRALVPARGEAPTRWTLEHMKDRTDESARITGLRLLRSLAPPEYAGVVATFLDSEQHAVKKEAINALRAIVDGDPPLEELSVFQAIEQAKKWKARVR